MKITEGIFCNSNLVIYFKVPLPQDIDWSKVTKNIKWSGNGKLNWPGATNLGWYYPRVIHK